MAQGMVEVQLLEAENGQLQQSAHMERSRIYPELQQHS